MTRYLSHALIDENGQIWGGAAGDQTGREVAVTAFANHSSGWDVALRYVGNDAKNVKNKIVKGFVYAAENNAIGYDQGGRNTLWARVKAIGWKPESIAKVGKCETDCSSLVGVVVNCALGYEACKSDIYTGNEWSYLKKLGFVRVTNFSATNGNGLQVADILLAENHHTACYIGTSKKGTYYSSSTEASKQTASVTTSKAKTVSTFGGTYRCTVNQLHIRTSPSTKAAHVGYYKKGETVVLDNWYKIAEGYVWGRYTGAQSHAKRYVAVGPYTGKAEANDYLVKVK